MRLSTDDIDRLLRSSYRPEPLRMTIIGKSCHGFNLDTFDVYVSCVHVMAFAADVKRSFKYMCDRLPLWWSLWTPKVAFNEVMVSWFNYSWQCVIMTRTEINTHLQCWKPTLLSCCSHTFSFKCAYLSPWCFLFSLISRDLDFGYQVRYMTRKCR